MQFFFRCMRAVLEFIALAGPLGGGRSPFSRTLADAGLKSLRHKD